MCFRTGTQRLETTNVSCTCLFFQGLLEEATRPNLTHCCLTVWVCTTHSARKACGSSVTLHPHSPPSMATRLWARLPAPTTLFLGVTIPPSRLESCRERRVPRQNCQCKKPPIAPRTLHKPERYCRDRQGPRASQQQRGTTEVEKRGIVESASQ